MNEEAMVAPLSDKDVAAIKAVGPALDEAAIAGDWKTLVALFTEGASLMGPNEPTVRGRSALLDGIESSGMTVSEHNVEFTEVHGYGEIAHGMCTWSETIHLPGVPDPIKEVGKILGVLRKQSDGRWLIAAWSWNSDLPLPE